MEIPDTVPPVPDGQPLPVSPLKPAAPTAIRKSWAERLFTPENVRILQSLGNSINYPTAVAYVRTHMWNESGAQTRLLILVAGTAACSVTGYALRRWLSLRITGLGFLILGQLSLILDAYSALLDPGSNGHGLYPYSPSSLWTVLFVIFTAMAAFKAKVLKEPLFDAFTYFGGLAAWGAGALWLGVDPYLLAASFVPALLISAALAQLIRPASQPPKPEAPEGEARSLRVPRWSLPWWLGAGFEIGGVLLAVILPIAAVLSGKAALAEHFAAHASALIGLALSIFAVGYVQNRRADARPIHSSVYHAASLLLLLPAPLAAYAFAWTFASWPVAFALPGAGLALVGLLLERLSKPRSAHLKAVSQWGLASTIAGLSWALVAHVQGGVSPASLWTAGAALSVTLVYAVVCDLAWAAWLSTVCSGFLTLLALEQAHVSADWLPSITFSVALLSHALWTALRRSVSAHGRGSSEILASLAAVLLLTHTPILPGAGGAMNVTAQVSIGWLAFFAFALSTSFWKFGALRRSLGIALAAPALAYTCYHAGFAFAAPAPYLAVLALAVILACQLSKRTKGGEIGVAAILAHGAILAGYSALSGNYVPAAMAFGLLALAALVQSQFQRARREHAWAMLSEIGGLGLLSLSGVCAFESLHYDYTLAPLAYSIMGVLILALAKIGSALGQKLYAPDARGQERPFNVSAPICALALSSVALIQSFQLQWGPIANPALLLTTIWTSGLLPLGIALRGRIFKTAQESSGASADGSPSSTSAAWILALGFGCLAALRLVLAEFWSPSCPTPLRLACAALLSVVLVASIVALLRKWSFAPVTAMLAAVGLASCACAQWAVPPECFGLYCALLAFATIVIEQLAPQRDDSSARFEAAQLIASFFAVSSLLTGLASWPVHGAQYLAAAAWLALAGAWWRRSSHRRYAFATVIAVALSAAHALRWSGLAFNEFGPRIAGVALIALACAEFVRFVDRQRNADIADAPTGSLLLDVNARANAILSATAFVGFGALSCSVWGALAGLVWQWSATLAECALGVAGLTLMVRRIHNFSGKELPRGLLVTLEMIAWSLLTVAIVALCSSAAADIPLAGPTWVLLGAIYLALGMAAESLFGALSGSSEPQKSPACLESRHVAALALGCIGLWNALSGAQHLDATQALWRTLFSLAAIAIYGSFARISVHERGAEWAQKFSGGAAYIVLLPAAYLNLLFVNSNGGSWCGMYFMLLVPVLMAAQYVLKREKREDQAALAQCGAAVVSAGSLLLAFAGNPLHLSAVPAAVLAAIALEMLLVRAMTGMKKFTGAACVAMLASAYFALQALIGFPIIGGDNPWAWQMPLLSLLGLAMIVIGGACKLDEIPLRSGLDTKPARGSLVALCGVWASVLTLLASLLYVALFGMRAHFPLWENTAYFDGLIVSVLLLAAVSVAASRWLSEWEPVRMTDRYLAPLATLTGYLLFVLRDPPHAWEWYSVPAAVFVFGWAWQAIQEIENRSERTPADAESRAVALLLLIGSALTLVPSFLQELPISREGTEHFFALLAVAIALVFGALLSRRKIPLLAGSAGLIIGTIVKAVQWAHHRDGIVPLMGVLVGFALVGVSTLLESRMNQAFRKAVDRARAEARMFWVSWQ